MVTKNIFSQASALARSAEDQFNLEVARLGSPSLRNSLRNRKRALSASPYSDIDINAMIRYGVIKRKREKGNLRKTLEKEN